VVRFLLQIVSHGFRKRPYSTTYSSNDTDVRVEARWEATSSELGISEDVAALAVQAQLDMLHIESQLESIDIIVRQGSFADRTRRNKGRDGSQSQK